ncbi:MAG TPA: hypothetical protein VMY40_14985 [Anaerolineae bacterium]|nr:hypothetical protein [Anaerolineae bacterium]
MAIREQLSGAWRELRVRVSWALVDLGTFIEPSDPPEPIEPPAPKSGRAPFNPHAWPIRLSPSGPFIRDPESEAPLDLKPPADRG